MIFIRRGRRMQRKLDKQGRAGLTLLQLKLPFRWSIVKHYTIKVFHYLSRSNYHDAIVGVGRGRRCRGGWKSNAGETSFPSERQYEEPPTNP